MKKLPEGAKLKTVICSQCGRPTTGQFLCDVCQVPLKQKGLEYLARADANRLIVKTRKEKLGW